MDGLAQLKRRGTCLLSRIRQQQKKKQFLLLAEFFNGIAGEFRRVTGHGRSRNSPEIE